MGEGRVRAIKKPRLSTRLSLTYELGELHAAEAGVDFAENAADDRAEDHEGRNNDNGYQNEDQSIFNETLAFFFR
jgi:hypothetical protein